MFNSLTHKPWSYNFKDISINIFDIKPRTGIKWGGGSITSPFHVADVEQTWKHEYMQHYEQSLLATLLIDLFHC